MDKGGTMEDFRKKLSGFKARKTLTFGRFGSICGAFRRVKIRFDVCGGSLRFLNDDERDQDPVFENFQRHLEKHFGIPGGKLKQNAEF